MPTDIMPCGSISLEVKFDEKYNCKLDSPMFEIRHSTAKDIDPENEYAMLLSSTSLVAAPTSPKSPSFKPTTMFSYRKEKELFGKKMTVVKMNNNIDYLIGVQIAHFLKRETFNLYRSMKLNNIDIIKCLPDQIEELTQIDAIKRGIHSVTLVPYNQGVLYIAKELKRKPRKKTDKKVNNSSEVEPETFSSNSSSESESNVIICCDDTSHNSKHSKKIHWKKLLLVASLERMRLNNLCD